MKNSRAFTLTEVLIAVAIVGIIAGLVLPKVIENYQTNSMNSAFKREIQTIEDSINGLAVSENKSDFFGTMMYVDSTPKNYDYSSGVYMKKYLRVSKMCNDPEDCFAAKYYQYVEGKSRNEYKPDYKGACAILKNGMSICMTPQIGAENIKGIIDLNGKNGPNVFERDLRTFEISAKTRVGLNQDTEGVRKLDWENIDSDEPEPEPETPPTPPTPTDPCDVDKNSLDCCKARSIASSSDPCCTYKEFKNTETCSEKVQIDFYCSIPSIPPPPSGINTYSQSLSISCKITSTYKTPGIYTARVQFPSRCQCGGGQYSCNNNYNFRESGYYPNFSYVIDYFTSGGMAGCYGDKFGKSTVYILKSGATIYSYTFTNTPGSSSSKKLEYNPATGRATPL